MTFSLKFLPLKDLIFSVIPTVGTYLGYLQGLSPEYLSNKWIALGIGLFVSILLAIFFYRDNVRSYKKDLAELLATGYFMNFTGKLGTLFNSKSEIEFVYPDKTSKSFHPRDIFVTIGLPEGINSLEAFKRTADSRSQILFVNDERFNEPFWLKAETRENSLRIYEYPRTLYSIPKYLTRDFSKFRLADKKSKKIFRYFNDKIDELRSIYRDQLDEDVFDFQYIKELKD